MDSLTPQQLYKKNYYEKNKHKLKEMVKCEVCNCNIQKYTRARHIGLKKHQDNTNAKKSIT